MSKSNHRIRVTVSEQARAVLHEVAEAERLSKKHLPSESILFLYNFYLENKERLPGNTPSVNYEADEQKEIDQAVINSGLPLETIIKDGTLQRVRYLNSIADKQAELESLSEEEIKLKTFKGAAKYRIQQAVEKVMEHNDLQPEKKNKVCLTKGIIFKLTGSNRQTINKFFDEYAVMISDHNGKHELTEGDNRKGKGFSFEELLGV